MKTSLAKWNWWNIIMWYGKVLTLENVIVTSRLEWRLCASCSDVHPRNLITLVWMSTAVGYMLTTVEIFLAKGITNFPCTEDVHLSQLETRWGFLMCRAVWEAWVWCSNRHPNSRLIPEVKPVAQHLFASWESDWFVSTGLLFFHSYQTISELPTFGTQLVSCCMGRKSEWSGTNRELSLPTLPCNLCLIHQYWRFVVLVWHPEQQS